MLEKIEGRKGAKVSGLVGGEGRQTGNSRSKGEGCVFFFLIPEKGRIFYKRNETRNSSCYLNKKQTTDPQSNVRAASC